MTHAYYDDVIIQKVNVACSKRSSGDRGNQLLLKTEVERLLTFDAGDTTNDTIT